MTWYVWLIIGAGAFPAIWFLCTRILVIRVHPSLCAICADVPPDDAPADAVIQFPREPDPE